MWWFWGCCCRGGRDNWRKKGRRIWVLVLLDLPLFCCGHWRLLDASGFAGCSILREQRIEVFPLACSMLNFIKWRQAGLAKPLAHLRLIREHTQSSSATQETVVPLWGLNSGCLVQKCYHWATFPAVLISLYVYWDRVLCIVQAGQNLWTSCPRLLNRWSYKRVWHLCQQVYFFKSKFLIWVELSFCPLLPCQKCVGFRI